MKALGQGRHCFWGLTLRRAIKKETIAINRDWVYKQYADCRMLSILYPTLLYVDLNTEK